MRLILVGREPELRAVQDDREYYVGNYGVHWLFEAGHQYYIGNELYLGDGETSFVQD